MAVFVEQSAQPRSPGAARSGTRADCDTPPEDSDEMLLLTQLPLDSCAPANVVCWYERNEVVPATPMIFSPVAGEPVVPFVPASPVLATTVTPASTAAASAREIGSFPLSGN